MTVTVAMVVFDGKSTNYKMVYEGPTEVTVTDAVIDAVRHDLWEREAPMSWVSKNNALPEARRFGPTINHGPITVQQRTQTESIKVLALLFDLAAVHEFWILQGDYDVCYQTAVQIFEDGLQEVPEDPRSDELGSGANAQAGGGGLRAAEAKGDDDVYDDDDIKRSAEPWTFGSRWDRLSDRMKAKLIRDAPVPQPRDGPPLPESMVQARKKALLARFVPKLDNGVAVARVAAGAAVVPLKQRFVAKFRDEFTAFTEVHAALYTEETAGGKAKYSEIPSCDQLGHD
ncbi:hypothetical protein FJY94_08780 [Candidatus Kaiserbacteria bacterium]|nr:hypothetical protein [Candidatus Kaiserbacteria bacterium]